LGIGDVQSENYAEYFNGLIDEVHISDVALTPGGFLTPEPSGLAVRLGAVVPDARRSRTQGIPGV